MGKVADITGHKYNRLTVLRYHGLVEQGAKKHKRAAWVCECECGNVLVATSNALRKNNTKSCGCLKIETAGDARRSHGKSRTPIYETWSNMIARCEYQDGDDFHHYGGRGIKVCERWRNSFEDFLTDMGDRPFQGASLDRVDVNRDYEPGNCRWVTQKEQCRNKRNNVIATVGGVSKTLGEWAEVTGVKIGLIRERLLRGWPPEKAVLNKRFHRFSGYLAGFKDSTV